MKQISTQNSHYTAALNHPQNKSTHCVTGKQSKMNYHSKECRSYHNTWSIWKFAIRKKVSSFSQQCTGMEEGQTEPLAKKD